MTGATSLPSDLDAITPAWLTAVLQERCPGVDVHSVELLDAHSGTTGRARIRVTASGTPGLPETLFVKLPPFDAGQRAFVDFTGIGVVEARFYAALGDDLPVRAPRVWFAAADEAGGYVMVLEDLLGTGCRFPAPADADVDEVAASTVEEMARLHARFWESSRFDTVGGGDLAWMPTRAGFGGLGDSPEAAAAAGEFVRRAVEPFRGTQSAAFNAVADLYVAHTEEVLARWDEGERTLIHGDAHMNNLFVDGRRTGFFDWAMLSRSPGVRDVSYFCCYSLPRDVRRSVEDDLLRAYLDALAAEGVSLDTDDAWRQYRLFSVYAWVSATTTAAEGGRWQPEAYAVEGMERAASAVEDLDAPGLLAELVG
ncbi:MAG TPA: phosphotransferase [Acidimicrobiia bacterium]|nr:phosphotransferase [Acidimicrobiia bacterium]